MALARIGRWLCGGGGDDGKPIETKSSVQVEGPKNPIETKSKVDVDIKAPKEVKITHGVDLSGINPIQAVSTIVGNMNPFGKRVADSKTTETENQPTKKASASLMSKN